MNLKLTTMTSTSIDKKKGCLISFRYKKLYYSLVFLFLLVESVVSQNFPIDPNQIKEIPSSPTMWEFEKYGNYPVSMHTGVPNISIPMFSATSGQLSVPVSLSYHASGIKVEQKATAVGLGWTLMAGGAITRTVRGGPDELDRGFINSLYSTFDNYKPEIIYSDTEQMIQGFIDTEPDIFSYSFLGYSGKFVFNHSQDRNNVTIVSVPHNDLKVTPIFSSGTSKDIIAFTVVTPQGIVAQFAYPEKATAQKGNSFGTPYYFSSNNTWHLKSLIAANGKDKIDLEYELVSTDGSVIDFRYSETASIKFDMCLLTQYSYGVPGYSLSSTTFSDVKKLKKISFDNGFIHFENTKGNRLDDPNDEEMRLDAVRLYSSMNSNDSTLIKSYEMEYGYFGDPAYHVRLKLNKIHEEGSNGARNKPHEFFYKETLTSDILPVRSSRAQDHWGYYNGKIANTSLAGKVSTLVNGTTVYIGNADRSVSSNHVQAGILYKIKYPTQGHTEFEYASNECIVYNVPYIAGGLRIEKISNFDSDASLASVKSYEYVKPDNTTLSSGIYNGVGFIDDQDYLSNRIYKLNGDCSGAMAAREIRTIGTSSTPNINLNLATVFYSSVKEYNGTPLNNSGYTWYHYDTTKDDFYQATGPLSFSNDRSWDRGQLILQETFANGNPNPISKTTNEYEELTYQSPIKGIKLGTNWAMNDIYYLPLSYSDTQENFRKYYYLKKEYNETIVWKRLKKTTQVNDGVSNQTEFFYDLEMDYTNVVKTVSGNSRLESIEVIKSYPDDVTTVSSLGNNDLTPDELDAIDALKTPDASYPNRLHRIAEPIQTETIVKNDVGTVLSKNVARNNYKDWDLDLSLSTDTNLIVPESVTTLKGIYNSLTNPMEERVTYHLVDDFGHPLELSKKDGIHVSYIWGYNNHYPIAKLENINHAQISSQVSNLQNLSNLDNSVSTELALRNALSSLRSSVPNAMVTTYTYDPLVGVTSITDSRGQSVYYHYDDFNRLEEVKDADGKLVTDYEYHYKNQ